MSDEDAGTVLIYTYPGLKPAGSLSGFSTPAGMCVDPKSGNVWITDTLRSDVVEFAHGGTTPIQTLTDGDGITQTAVPLIRLMAILQSLIIPSAATIPATS